MELPSLCREHCVWARMWHHPVFWNHQGSVSLPLSGKLEGLCGYWTMILSAFSWNYFIALCLVWTFSSANSRSSPSTQSLSGESCSSTHSFFHFSEHYSAPAGACYQIIKEQLPHRKMLCVEAPTAACPNTCGLRGPVHCCLQLKFKFLLLKATLWLLKTFWLHASQFCSLSMNTTLGTTFSLCVEIVYFSKSKI